MAWPDPHLMDFPDQLESIDLETHLKCQSAPPQSVQPGAAPRVRVNVDAGQACLRPPQRAPVHTTRRRPDGARAREGLTRRWGQVLLELSRHVPRRLEGGDHQVRLVMPSLARQPRLALDADADAQGGAPEEGGGVLGRCGPLGVWPAPVDILCLVVPVQDRK